MEALIGPETVDTMPPETFETYKHQGNPKVRIHDDLPLALEVFDGLTRLNIDRLQISRELEEEGIKKFAASYDKLLSAVQEKENTLRVA